MISRLSLIVFGLIFTTFGILLIIRPVFYDIKHGINQDFSQIKWPLGSGFIVLGCLFVFISLRKKSFENITLICPKCEETLEQTIKKEIICPCCGTTLEDLKGFYERHPELKP